VPPPKKKKRRQEDPERREVTREAEAVDKEKLRKN
jgi:hypothetical protein